MIFLRDDTGEEVRLGSLYTHVYPIMDNTTVWCGGKKAKKDLRHLLEAATNGTLCIRYEFLAIPVYILRTKGNKKTYIGYFTKSKRKVIQKVIREEEELKKHESTR